MPALRIFLLLTAGCVGLTAACPAEADWDNPRFYAALHAGLSVAPDSTLGPGLGSFSFSSVPVGGGSAGIAFGHLRVEEELSYRGSEISQTNILGYAFNGGGNLGALSLMSNVFYDFYMTRTSALNVGFGVGVTQLSTHSDPGQLNAYNGQILATNGSANVFSYQVMVGVSDDITDNVTVGAMYRYFATTYGNFYGSVEGSGGTFTTWLAAHEVVGTVRYNF